MSTIKEKLQAIVPADNYKVYLRHDKKTGDVYIAVNADDPEILLCDDLKKLTGISLVVQIIVVLRAPPWKLKYRRSDLEDSHVKTELRRKEFPPLAVTS